MSQFRLKNRTTGIPGGFLYVCPSSGLLIGPTSNLFDLLTAVARHTRSNNLPDVSSADVEAQICFRHPEHCRPATQLELSEIANSPQPGSGSVFPVTSAASSGTGPSQDGSHSPSGPVPSLSISLSDQPPARSLPLPSVQQVAQATKSIALWTFRGRNKATTDQATARSQVCLNGGPAGSTCPWHAPLEPCSGCVLTVLHKAINYLVGSADFPLSSQLGACRACGSCSLVAKVQLPIDFLLTRNEKLPTHCWIVQEAAAIGYSINRATVN